MKSFTLLLVCLFASIGSLQAQIYADVTVSHGANPLGTFRILLHHDVVPRTVANFVGLATGERNWIDTNSGGVQVNKPYYDGLIFHRLIHNFMIQGGDPLGTGGGGPGYIFQDEFDQTLRHDENYVVSMANSGANSNGSQFFITLSTPTHLDDKHSVFGTVINDATFPNSRALIDSFRNNVDFPTIFELNSEGELEDTNIPITPITIDSVAISGSDFASFDIHDPALRLPTVESNSVVISHDSTDSTFALTWDLVRKFDYPLYFSSDLENWTSGGNLLSLDNSPGNEVNISAIATEPSTFYVSTAIDYTSVIEAPQNVLAASGSLELESTGGTLNLTFDGNAGGTWSFIYSDGITPADSGNITSSWQTDNSSYPVLPTTGAYVPSYPITSYARSLSLRQITAFLDGEAGPELLTAVQPVLSFHETSTGWYDGLVNTNSSQNITFRGEFSYTAPE